MGYVGIDWAYRRAAWCALGEGGAVGGEGVVAADEDGLVRLVVALGSEVRLTAVGCRVQVAHARRVRDVAPLACKTDKVDARVLSSGTAAITYLRGNAVASFARLQATRWPSLSCRRSRTGSTTTSCCRGWFR
jgi:hypothetical protein